MTVNAILMTARDTFRFRLPQKPAGRTRNNDRSGGELDPG